MVLSSFPSACHLCILSNPVPVFKLHYWFSCYWVSNIFIYYRYKFFLQYNKYFANTFPTDIYFNSIYSFLSESYSHFSPSAWQDYKSKKKNISIFNFWNSGTEMQILEHTCCFQHWSRIGTTHGNSLRRKLNCFWNHNLKTCQLGRWHTAK